jgi:hypothetical protein
VRDLLCDDDGVPIRLFAREGKGLTIRIGPKIRPPKVDKKKLRKKSRRTARATKAQGNSFDLQKLGQALDAKG